MATTKVTPRLKEKYSTEVIPALQKRFNYKSSMQVPRLEKIAINRGVNGAVNDKKLVDIALEELSTISGQKAVPTMSKKDISNFKLRKNMPIGAKVTLRGEKMYEFLDRLIAVALPRVRDFKGVNEKSFDGRVPRTEYRLTAEGRAALARYLDHMEALIRATRDR